MDPQSVTNVALAVLGAAGFVVAITGFIHFRRSRDEASTAATPPTEES